MHATAESGGGIDLLDMLEVGGGSRSQTDSNIFAEGGDEPKVGGDSDMPDDTLEIPESDALAEVHEDGNIPKDAHLDTPAEGGSESVEDADILAELFGEVDLEIPQGEDIPELEILSEDEPFVSEPHVVEGVWGEKGDSKPDLGIAERESLAEGPGENTAGKGHSLGATAKTKPRPPATPKPKTHAKATKTTAVKAKAAKTKKVETGGKRQGKKNEPAHNTKSDQDKDISLKKKLHSAT